YGVQRRGGARDAGSAPGPAQAGPLRWGRAPPNTALNMEYFHPPLLKTRLKRETVGPAVVEDIDPLAAQIIGAPNIRSNHKSIRKLIVRSSNDFNIRSPDGGCQRPRRRTGGKMRAVAQERGDGPRGARDHDDFDIQPILIEDLHILRHPRGALKPRMPAVVGDKLFRSFDVRSPEPQESAREKNTRTVEIHSNSRIGLVIRRGRFLRASASAE